MLDLNEHLKSAKQQIAPPQNDAESETMPSLTERLGGTNFSHMLWIASCRGAQKKRGSDLQLIKPLNVMCVPLDCKEK